MKLFRILGRNIRDALKSVSRNFSLSVASITCTAITLILVAIAMVVSYNINDFSKEIKKELTIRVYVTADATEEDAELLGSKIKSLDNVIEVTYATKEEVKQEIMETDEAFRLYLEGKTETNNPLLARFIIETSDIENIKSTVTEIKEFTHVSSVFYGENVIDKIIPTFNIVEKATIVIVIALVLVTTFLISNTIKLTIFSRKNEIEIMRLVGTSNIVIRLPFLFEGFIIGIIGSILPVIVTIYGYMFVYDKTGGVIINNLMKLTSPLPFVLIISGLLLAIGALVGMFGSYRAVRKYLKI